MSDFEDTNEIQSPRPLPEILGPVSREERGKLFEKFAEQINQTWMESQHSYRVDKDRLLIVSDTPYDTHREYFSFLDGQFERANLLSTDGVRTRLVREGDEGKQELSIDAADFEGKVYVLRTEETEKGYVLKIIYIDDEISDSDEGKTFSNHVTFGAIDQKENITDGVAGTVYESWDNERSLSFLSPSGKFRISNGGKDEPFISVEEKRGEEFMVRYRIPKKIDVTNIEKLIPQDLIRDAYDAPATADKWRHADFLEVLGIERGEVEAELPEL